MTGPADDDHLWSAIGEPTRRRMLDILLTDGHGTATTLGRRLPITRQAVAKHLAVLERAGLIRATSTGREKRYQICHARLAHAVSRLTTVGADWEGRLHRLKHLAEALTAPGVSPTPSRKAPDMVDILHRIGIRNADPATVYTALTTTDGLAAWWTEQTSGNAETGGKLQFRFPPVGGFDMEVLDTTPATHVGWRVVDGPAEWIGTTVDWDLHQDDDWTILLFRHAGWREPVEFMNHCSTKWATFLLSLKALVETGEGAPAPRDVEISNWH